MTSDLQSTLAEKFRSAHRGPLLLLPNAWDAMSARQFEAAGFPAIATTSGGVAWDLGFADGEKAPWREVLAATARIVQAVRVPVTADIEAGTAIRPPMWAAASAKSSAPA
jgi:2-methylisocitrate lyase-like PEP mutase family enzyme